MSQAELGVFYEGCMTGRADKDIYSHSTHALASMIESMVMMLHYDRLIYYLNKRSMDLKIFEVMEHSGSSVCF